MTSRVCDARRVTRRFALASLLSVACSPIDVGLEVETGVTPTTGGPEASTTTLATGASGDTTAGSGLASSSSTSASAGTGVSASSSSDDGSSDGTAGLEDSPCEAEQKVCAAVTEDGQPAGFCGQTLQIKGIVAPLGDNRYLIEDCGACELCGGPQFEVEFFAPMGWEPAPLPLCSRVALEFAPLDGTPWACAFVGVSVWGDDGLGEDPAPRYLAESIDIDVPGGVSGLSVVAENVAPKDCELDACCPEPPGDYTFTFSGAGIAPPLELAEGEEALGVGAFGVTYDILNERSHVHEQCDKIPHLDWIMRRTP